MSQKCSEGKIVRCIIRDDKSLFRTPILIGRSPDQATMFVTDHRKVCIGLSLEGQITFQYQGTGMMVYENLAVGRNCCYEVFKEATQNVPTCG